MRTRFVVIGLGIRGLALVTWLGSESFATVAPGQDQVPLGAFRFIDLAPSAVLFSSDALVGRSFANFPTGAQTFHGVPFRISQKLALTGMESARNGELYPAQILGID